MANKVTLIGATGPMRDGTREWRFVVNGNGRSFYTIHACTRSEAERELEAKLQETQLAQIGEDSSGFGSVVAIGAIGAVCYGVYKFIEWWRRSEDGPSGGWGIGFGKGNGGFNLNPFDKGKAGTGDGGEGIGEQWERATVLGVKGWRRKGIPLPKQKGGPASYQQGVLIVGEGGAIPDLSKWPKNLPVFFVHDPDQEYPDPEGGWLADARFGDNETEKNYGSYKRWFACASTDSDELRKCMAAELESMLPDPWE